MKLIAALCLAGLPGCAITSIEPVLESPTAARKLFDEQVYPMLQARCDNCHAQPSFIDFMSSGTADGTYQALFAYQPPLLDLESPAASLMLHQPTHGPLGLDAQALHLLRVWIEAEAAER